MFQMCQHYKILSLEKFLYGLYDFKTHRGNVLFFLITIKTIFSEFLPIITEKVQIEKRRILYITLIEFCKILENKFYIIVSLDYPMIAGKLIIKKKSENIGFYITKEN